MQADFWRAARSRLGLLLATAAGLGPFVALPAHAQPAGRSALEVQIRALQAEKRARTPAQRKLSSQLIYEARMRRGLPIAPGIEQLYTEVDVDWHGRALVDIRGDVGGALERRIEAAGGTVLSVFPAYRTLRARLPLEQAERLAELEEIDSIRPADRAITHKTNTSEGDTAHFAAAARAAFGVDGTGVTVGVLSDGVDVLEDLQFSGDLPADVTVLSGQAGSGNEGTAMLEIVHDLAPGASLMFATAFAGQGSFATNILALRTAGADVIVDDVGYFAESVFQDDDVAESVNMVTAGGALYFSSAGNSGNLDDGTAGVWEGDFAANGTFNGEPVHDFGGSIMNEVTQDSPFAFTLQWADPKGASSNDYDLYLTNKKRTMIFAASTDVQAGAGDPFEFIGSSFYNDKGRYLLIVRSSGSDRFLHLNANRGRLEFATDGQTWGHSAAREAFSVAAVDARLSPGGFTGAEPVESYSSDGPRRVFYEHDDTPITPGDFSASGGEVRAKPDLTAADCVSTAAPGFSTFCGTSAAAPHAAAIAALLIERGGGPGVADPADVRAALLGTALDIEAAGPDRDSGAGIAEAEAATGAMPVPECGSDADCDDGAFCNGAEGCDAGSCVAGAPPACTGGTPLCDEGLDACVECLGAADCDDGAFCNGAEGCDAGSCVAGAPPACTGGTPLCDEGLDACVVCLGAADCSGGSCNAGGLCEAPPPVPAMPSRPLWLLVVAILLGTGFLRSARNAPRR
jgi:hypothetical protein